MRKRILKLTSMVMALGLMFGQAHTSYAMFNGCSSSSSNAHDDSLFGVSDRVFKEHKKTAETKPYRERVAPQFNRRHCLSDALSDDKILEAFRHVVSFDTRGMKVNLERLLDKYAPMLSRSGELPRKADEEDYASIDDMYNKYKWATSIFDEYKANCAGRRIAAALNNAVICGAFRTASYDRGFLIGHSEYFLRNLCREYDRLLEEYPNQSFEEVAIKAMENLLQRIPRHSNFVQLAIRPLKDIVKHQYIVIQ